MLCYPSAIAQPHRGGTLARNRDGYAKMQIVNRATYYQRCRNAAGTAAHDQDQL